MPTLPLNELLSALSLFCAAIGILVLVSATGLYHSIHLTLPLALDFWMAAGLLKLAGFPSWKTIATVAAIVLIRKAVTMQFKSSRPPSLKKT